MSFDLAGDDAEDLVDARGSPGVRGWQPYERQMAACLKLCFLAPRTQLALAPTRRNARWDGSSQSRHVYPPLLNEKNPCHSKIQVL